MSEIGRTRGSVRTSEPSIGFSQFLETFFYLFRDKFSQKCLFSFSVSIFAKYLLGNLIGGLHL